MRSMRLYVSEKAWSVSKKRRSTICGLRRFIFESISRVVRPVRPNAVSWNKEGRDVMHHCNISVVDQISLEILHVGILHHTLGLEVLKLAI